MSQAVIEFCDGLKDMLLGLEDRLAKAKASLAEGAGEATSEARKHIDEANEQLAKFKNEAARMARAIRADIPNQAAVREKLKEFGLEAQLALRHAVVFLAENTAEALQAGAKSAQHVAETLKHDTALTVTQDQKPAGG